MLALLVQMNHLSAPFQDEGMIQKIDLHTACLKANCKQENDHELYHYS